MEVRCASTVGLLIFIQAAISLLRSPQAMPASTSCSRSIFVEGKAEACCRFNGSRAIHRIVSLFEVAEPTLREFDVLVGVRAIGVNPGEAFMRNRRSAEPDGRVLLENWSRNHAAS